MSVFDPHEFFTLADTLLANSADEASLRTCISRAYYACHLVARDSIYGLDGRNLTKSEKKRLAKNPKGSGDHAAIIVAVATSTHLKSGPAKRLSDQLGQLKEMRERADYILDSQHRDNVEVFTKRGVRDWKGLAHAAMATASDALPALATLRRK